MVAALPQHSRLSRLGVWRWASPSSKNIADQEQVTEVDRLIAVSIPVVNEIDLGSNHDQLWPVRKVTNMTMGSLGPALLDGRSIVVSRADRDLSAWWGYILTSTHVKCEINRKVCGNTSKISMPSMSPQYKPPPKRLF